MGVTDLTPNLPWGGSSNGQTQLPPGYAGTSWLDYFASMFNPVGSAQASETPRPPPGGADGVNPYTFAATAPPAPPGPPAAPPMAAPAPAPPGPMAGDPRAYDRSVSAMGSQADPSGGPAWTHMPAPGAPSVAAAAPYQPNVNPANIPSAAAQPVSSQAAPGGAAGAPRAAPMGGAPANPRFGTVQYQTPNSVGNRAPIYTAMNLGGLFGGGQPAAPAAAPRVPGPMAGGPPISPTTGKPMPTSSMDVAYGLPDARGAPYPYALGRPSVTAPLPPTMPDDIAQRRRAIALASAGKHSGYA